MMRPEHHSAGRIAILWVRGVTGRFPSVSRGLLIVLAIALALRLLAIADTRDFAPSGDAADYNRNAVWLAETGRFAPTILAEPGGATAFRPPAFPLFLAGIYAVVGERYTVARGIEAVLGVAFVWLLYLVAARLFGRRVALWAAAIAAVAPPLVWVNGSLLSESLFLPAAFGAILCALAFRERERLWLVVLAGLLIGLATSTRTNGITLALPLAIAVARGTGLRRLAAPAVLVACMALALVPWTVRNASVFDRFLPLGTQGGFTMSGQWNALSDAAGEYNAVWIVPQGVPDLAGHFRRPGVDEGDLDATLRRAARRYAQDHPGHVFSAAALNTLRSFDLGPAHSFMSEGSFTEMAVPRGQWWTLRASIYLLTLLALVGTVLALVRRRAGPVWFWLVPVLMFASGIAWLGNPRHTLTIYAFMTIPAAYALCCWRSQGTATGLEPATAGITTRSSTS